MVTLVADGLVAGVDMHKDVHIAVVLDRLGRRLAVRICAADAGNAQLAEWLAGAEPVTDAGVEGTGGSGWAGPAAGRGGPVGSGGNRCPDRSRRRRKGKSDPVDAQNATRAVLAGEATAIPKDRRGFAGELRVLLLTGAAQIKARTQASNQIKAFLPERRRWRRYKPDCSPARWPSSSAGYRRPGTRRWAAPGRGRPGPPVAGPGH